MGFRFSKRIKLAPGVSLNLGKRGASVSVGPKGMKTTIGKRGVRHSVSIPGTGMRYETPYKPIGKKKTKTGKRRSKQAQPENLSVWEKIKRFFS